MTSETAKAWALVEVAEALADNLSQISRHEEE
jgi:hypothetical protein